MDQRGQEDWRGRDGVRGCTSLHAAAATRCKSRWRDTTTVSEHIVKTRPGATGLRVVVVAAVVVYREYTLRFHLPVAPRLDFFFVRQRAGLSFHPAYSFDYCFVKCDVKDSKITLSPFPELWSSLYRLLRPSSWLSLFLLSLSLSTHRRIANTATLTLSLLSLSEASSLREGSKCSLRKFKFIPGSRSLEERIKGPSMELSGSTRRYLILPRARLRKRTADMLWLRSRRELVSLASGALLFHFRRRILRKLTVAILDTE